MLLFGSIAFVGMAVGALLSEWLGIAVGAAIAGIPISVFRLQDGVWLDFTKDFQVGHPQLYLVIKVPAIVMFVCGTVVGVSLGLAIGRHVVVDRLRWMTHKEVEDFYRRDPGF
jgi:hypothetical protein